MILGDQNEVDMDRLKKHCTELAEHFDTVHIFVTRHEEGEIGTTNANWCLGNHFTRHSQIGNWLVKENERTRLQARKQWEEDND